MSNRLTRVGSVVVLLGLVFGGCADGPTDAFDPSFKPGNGGGGGGPFGTPTSLSVTFPDAIGDAVQSDGGGPYVDYEEDVHAIFSDQDGSLGQLQFGTDSDERNAVGRRLSLDLPVDWPGVKGSVIGRMITPHDDSDPFRSLQLVGETNISRLKVFWEADGWKYYLRYGFDCGAADPGEGIAITLVDDNPDNRTYVVTTVSEAILCRQPSKGKPIRERYPDYPNTFAAPLEMTITEIGGQSP